jgi:outer membrane protein TolC
MNAQQRDLNFYIEQAKKTSPLIQKNRNDNKLLDLDQKQTEILLRKPVINLESNILFAPIISHDNNVNRLDLVSQGASNYSGYDLSISNGGQFQAIVTLKQSLFKNTDIQRSRSRSEIQRQANDNSTALTVHEMEQLVGYQYIICLKSKTEIENSRILLKLLDDQLVTLQKLVAGAILKQTDLLLFQIEYQNAVLAGKTLQDDYKNNLYDLNLLCGITDTITADIANLDIQLKPDLNTPTHFLNSYRLDSLTILADLSISELKYRPQLDLFANAGLNAVYVPSLNRLGVSAGLTFSWNLYDGGQRKLEQQKSKVNLHTLSFEKEYFLSQKEINLNKIRSQLNALSERTSLIEKQLEKYDILYKAYENELAHGLISVMDFKNLLKDITAKKQESLLQKMEKQLLVNSYNYWNY